MRKPPTGMHRKTQLAVHEPLSQSLLRILENSDEAHPLTINQLLERTQGRGIYFAFIILSLPFVLWVSVPGMSVIVGPVIALMALRLTASRSERLPSWMGDRRLAPKVRKVILGGGSRFCRLLEKVARPRRTPWMTWRSTIVLNATLIMFMGLLLALPLPPFPFIASNALPSYAIVLLAVAMMEEDGVMVCIGYAAALANIVYFTLLGRLVLTHLTPWMHTLLQLFSKSQ
jgi:hypothetical protein